MSNIYEDPDVTFANMACNKEREDRGERVERIINIYESAGDSVHVSPQDKLSISPAALKPPVVHSDCFRAAALTLGFLCVLLFVGSTIMSRLYIPMLQEKEKLLDSFKQLQAEFNLLNRNYCPEENHTEVNAPGWTRFRCSCYYRSTGQRNWWDSRDDCLTRGADLVVIDSREEQEFVSKMSRNAESWIGLQSKTTKTDWTPRCSWTWVDTSRLEYQTWNVGVSSCVMAPHTAFIDLQGKWSHAENGTKQWICEKQI